MSHIKQNLRDLLLVMRYSLRIQITFKQFKLTLEERKKIGFMNYVIIQSGLKYIPLMIANVYEHIYTWAKNSYKYIYI